MVAFLILHIAIKKIEKEGNKRKKTVHAQIEEEEEEEEDWLVIRISCQD